MEQVQRVFLDHNSTTMIKDCVKDAMFEVMNIPLNASSVHGFGRESKKLINKSRKRILNAVNAKTDNAEVIFTSSGTEANNLAIMGFCQANYFIISSIEHVSILKATQKKAESSGKKLIYTPVDSNGVVLLEELENILKDNIDKSSENSFLVSIMLVNNETGVIQPIQEISEIVHKYGGYIHTDAVQAFGKISVDFTDLNVDMMTVSSHKIGGSHGAAALIIKHKIELKPIIYGGSQENNNRSGTENIPSIVGFGTAAKKINNNIANDLIGYAENSLCQYIDDKNDIEIFGKNVERIYNTSFIAMRGMDSQVQLINFDLEGIAVSNGSACSSGSVKISHVLKAMNIDDDIASCAIRISINADTQKSDMDRFIEIWKKNYQKVKIKNIKSG